MLEGHRAPGEADRPRGHRSTHALSDAPSGHMAPVGFSDYLISLSNSNTD